MRPRQARVHPLQKTGTRPIQKSYTTLGTCIGMGEIVVSETGKAVLGVLSNREWSPSREISESVGCAKETVNRLLSDFAEEGWVQHRVGEGKYGATLHRLDADVDLSDVLTRREKQLRKPCTLEMVNGGYVRARSQLDGHAEVVFIHRLLAVAEYGFEAVANRHVHHVNGIPWLNYGGNIELKTPEDHINDHWHNPSLFNAVQEASDPELADALERAGYTGLVGCLMAEVSPDES